jgi:hypothetical protein
MSLIRVVLLALLCSGCGRKERSDNTSQAVVALIEQSKDLQTAVDLLRIKSAATEKELADLKGALAARELLKEISPLSLATSNWVALSSTSPGLFISLKDVSQEGRGVRIKFSVLNGTSVGFSRATLRLFYNGEDRIVDLSGTLLPGSAMEHETVLSPMSLDRFRLTGARLEFGALSYNTAQVAK